MAGFEPRDPDVNDRFGSAADINADPLFGPLYGSEQTSTLRMSACRPNADTNHRAAIRRLLAMSGLRISAKLVCAG